MTPFWDYDPQLKVGDFVTKCYFLFPINATEQEGQDHCVHTEERHKNNETQMLAFRCAPSKHCTWSAR